MTRASICLTFNGNCMEAFNFYKDVFEKDFSYLEKYESLPEPQTLPHINQEQKNKVMNISLPICKDTLIMGCDSSEIFGISSKTDNGFAIFIHAESKEEADKLFTRISSRGFIVIPMHDTFWGTYYGTVVDKYGTKWMINALLNNNVL